MVLGKESSASGMLGEKSTTETHFQPLFLLPLKGSVYHRNIRDKRAVCGTGLKVGVGGEMRAEQLTLAIIEVTYVYMKGLIMLMSHICFILISKSEMKSVNTVLLHKPVTT